MVIDNTPETDADHQIVSDIFTECKRYVILSNKLKEPSKETNDVQPSNISTIEGHSNEITKDVQPNNISTIKEPSGNSVQPIDDFFQIEKLPSNRNFLQSKKHQKKKKITTKRVPINRIGSKGYSKIVRRGIMR